MQGPVINNDEVTTIEVVDSIKKYYPNAEVVLSTWENENVLGINYDRVILSKDPGCFSTSDGLVVNLNRQIVSTIEGLKVAKNNIVVKMRTDTVITSGNLNGFIEKINLKAKHFKNYILVSELFTRDPLKIDILFHPSDLFLVGKKSDLINLFSIKLSSKNDLLDDNGKFKVFPEQYIWLQYLLQYCKVNYFNRLKRTFRNLLESEKILHSNFIILSSDSLGVSFIHRIHNGWMFEKIHKEKLSFYYIRFRPFIDVLTIVRIFRIKVLYMLRKL